MLAQEVRDIFAAKCVECHDETVARPKGEFGYVLDLERIAANRKWVIPGQPQKSELYLMVFHEEMPGDEASAPPLTAEEKEIVRRWIALGAPSDHAEVATAALSPAPQPKPRELPFKRRLIRAIGQFHPVSSHFPIALLIAAFPAEIMWKRTRKPSWKAAVRFCVMLGAASAVFTAGLGWCDAVFSNYTGASAPVLWWHRWLGTATAVWAVLLAALSEFAHKEKYPRTLRYTFRALLLVTILLVSISGYLGGSLIYGLHHFRW